MAQGTGNDGRLGMPRGSIVAWSFAALLCIAPLLAMGVTDEVAWDGADFALFGGLLVCAGVAYEIAARAAASLAYRAATGVALLAAFVLVWMNLAVGLIGSEDNPANLMYGGVLVVGLVGAVVARFRPWGMSRALAAVALAQGVVVAIALGAGLTPAGPGRTAQTLLLTGFFGALWLLSAWLFRRAAREEGGVGADA